MTTAGELKRPRVGEVWATIAWRTAHAQNVETTGGSPIDDRSDGELTDVRG